MDRYWILAGILFLVLIPLITSGIREKRNKKLLREKLKTEYGKENPRKWKSGEIETISRYTFLRPKEGMLDELTWNDLDMDELYMQMAYTRSSPGDDCLYSLLHYPVKSEKQLNELEERIRHFQENEESRLDVQLLFQAMGRMGRVSLSQYLQYMSELKAQKNTVHYLVDLMILLSALLMIRYVSIGLPLLFCFLLYNLYTYFRHKGEIEPYLITFRYILTMLNYSGEIGKNLPLHWEEKQKLEAARHLNRKLSRNSYFLMSSGRMNADGLEIILDYLRMSLHLDIIKFNSMLYIMQENMEVLWDIYEVLGRLDSSIAIGSYRNWLPVYCKPVFSAQKGLEMTGIYHPLVENAVPNSLDMMKNIVLTGSNASGKSTFLKTAGVNVLLAQTINTCTARTFSLPFCSLYTAISLKDSIRKKESYYMAEIGAIKRILDAAGRGEKVICMVDEMLRGTNTTERIAAATSILREMTRQGVICMVATHDGELTRILEGEYDNYHFQEDFLEDDIVFSYQLKPMAANSSNAIRLLEKRGYPFQIVEEAREMMKEFERKGTWE